MEKLLYDGTVKVVTEKSITEVWFHSAESGDWYNVGRVGHAESAFEEMLNSLVEEAYRHRQASIEHERVASAARAEKQAKFMAQEERARRIVERLTERSPETAST